MTMATGRANHPATTTLVASGVVKIRNGLVHVKKTSMDGPSSVEPPAVALEDAAIPAAASGSLPLSAPAAVGSGLPSL
jgi:hypothetical protein